LRFFQARFHAGLTGGNRHMSPIHNSFLVIGLCIVWR
jgi:hypothetical protein